MRNLLLLCVITLVNGQMDGTGTPPAVSINVQTPTGPGAGPGAGHGVGLGAGLGGPVPVTRVADSSAGFVRTGGYPVNQYPAYDAVNPVERILYPPPPGMTPEVPNFYFNAGFNKAMGFQLPPFPGMAAATTYPGGHTPLGELMASKVDMLPAILKTGFFIAAVIVIFKIIAHLLTSFAHVGKIKKPTVTLAGHVPVVSIAGDAVSAKNAKLDESLGGRDKRDASASPVVPDDVDFDAMIGQLDDIVARFDRK